MNDTQFAEEFSKELDREVASTRKCLERIPFEKFDWKPHETSMQLGYLWLLVGEIPLWITYIIKEPEIDLATFPHLKPSSAEDVVKRFDENVASAKKALSEVKDGDLDKPFELKVSGKVVFSDTKRVNVESTINHMVHHRGQLTVYMRLNGIAVPSIYGPSADEKTF